MSSTIYWVKKNASNVGKPQEKKSDLKYIMSLVLRGVEIP